MERQKNINVIFMLVSVIVTTKNEEKNIGRCLQSIKIQNYPADKIEIIVVDNDSTDQTAIIARRYTQQVFNHGPERSAQRNFGINKARGEYFLFLDADMTLAPEVVSACVQRVEEELKSANPKSKLVGLYIREVITGQSFFSRVRRFERSFYNATAIDCVRFIQKAAFEKVGGFDENLTGPEDWDLDKKLRQIGETDLIKEPIYHNEAEFNLRRYLQKKAYYSQKFDTYIAKWGKNDPDIQKQFGLYYRFLGVFIEKGKWLRLLAHPILTLGMYFLRGLVGAGFLWQKIISSSKDNYPSPENTDLLHGLILLNAFWNNGQGVTGGDQMILQVLKRIRKKLGKIYFVTNHQGKLIIEKEVNELTFIISAKFFDRLGVSISYILRTLQAIRCLFIRKVDFILAGSDFFPDVLPAFIYHLIYPKTTWIQSIFHIYPNFYQRPGNKIKNFLAQYSQQFSLFLIKKSQATVIVINNEVKNFLTNKGFRADQINIISPGIDFNYLNQCPSATAEKDSYTGTFLARLSPSKGVEDLITIWQLVCKEIPSARLAIIGSGNEEMKNRLMQKINANGLQQQIKLLGFLDYAKTISIIKKSQVFLFPSHEEGFGIVIAEAMACGTPVFSWNLSIFDEVFKEHLIKIPLGNFQLFAQEVIRILKNSTAGENLSNSAKDFVKKYDWGKTAQSYLAILKKRPKF